MSAPITNVSPLPAVGFSVTINDAGVTQISPGPYANTVEVQVYNPDTTDDIWIAFANVVSVRSSFTIAESTNDDIAPFVGDTVTLDGNVLTAAGGPFVAGTDTFSVDIRATATIVVTNAPFPVGGTISLIVKKGSPNSLVTLTCIAGPRAPGSNTFQSLAGTAAQAAEIDAAINDSDWSPESVRSSSVVGSTVTCIAGNNVNKRGANGNTSALALSGVYGLGLQTSEPGFVTLSAFTGGVNADGGQTLQDGSFVVNQPVDYIQNLLRAIVNSGNSTSADFIGGQLIPTTAATIRVWAATAGTAGDGLVISTSVPAVFTVSSPTAGGIDYPVALTAATAIVVGPGQTRTLPIGREGERNPVQPSSFWTGSAGFGSNIGLVGQVEAGGGTVAANFTYINRL